MPRNTRTTSNRKNDTPERTRPDEGTKMHGSRFDASDREARMSREKDMNRKSTHRTRHTPRGH